MSIGSRIKEAREKKGLSQVKLAEALGISKGAIGNYECDKSSPKDSILFKLMTVLDVDANFLFQDELIDAQIKKDPVFTEPFDDMQKSAIRIFSGLSPDKQTLAYDYLQYLYEKQEKEENK